MLALLLGMGFAVSAPANVHPRVQRGLSGQSADIVLAASYDPRAAVGLAQADLAAARAASDRPRQLRAWRLLLRAQNLLDETQRADDDIDAAVALARELNDEEALSELLVSKGVLLGYQQRIDEAAVFFDDGERIAKENGLARQWVEARTERGTFYGWSGRTAESLSLLNEAYGAAEALGDRPLMSSALSSIADVQSTQRTRLADRRQAVDQFRRALALVDPTVYRVEATNLMHNLGVALYQLGDRNEARRQFDAAQPIADSMGDSLTVAYIDYRLARIALDDDQLAEAATHLAQARPVLNALGPALMRFKEQLATAELLARQDHRAESLAALETAMQTIGPARDPVHDAAYYESAAKVHARLGDMAQAYEMMRSLQEAERAGATAANDALAAELSARFELQRQAQDNAVLRASALEAETKRWRWGMVALSGVAVTAALALVLGLQVRQKRRYADLALRDELTGLPNRRSMLERLGHRLQGRRAQDEGFYAGVIDLDHFKQINDRHGHDVGDAVLRAFAAVCQPLLRETDQLGRIGGEEFLLLLTHAEESSVRAVFERMQRAVAAIAIPDIHLPRQLSFSMGLAAASPGDDVHALLKRADEALYVAKASGRNCCVVTGPVPGPVSADGPAPRKLDATA